MSSKRNRRGHRLIRRLAQSHLDSGKPIESFIFWSYRNDGMRLSHRSTMMAVWADHQYRQMVGRIYRNSQPSTQINIHRI